MISKIFQSGGIITKDTPLYMLNTPEKLEKYNSIVKKDYEMRKRLEANSTAKNDNLTTFKPVVTETEIELDPKKAALKRAMRTQQRQPEVKVDNPNKASFIADPTRPLVTTINPNANPSNVLSHLNTVVNPIQWGKTLVQTAKTFANPNTYLNLAKVAIGEQGGDEMQALNDALTIGGTLIGGKKFNLPKRNYLNNNTKEILNNLRRDGQQSGLRNWVLKRPPTSQLGNQTKRYAPKLRDTNYNSTFPSNYRLSNVKPLYKDKLTSNVKEEGVKQGIKSIGTYLELPQNREILSLPPITPNRNIKPLYKDKVASNIKDEGLNQGVNTIGTYLELPQNQRTLSLPSIVPQGNMNERVKESTYNVKSLPVEQIPKLRTITPEISNGQIKNKIKNPYAFIDDFKYDKTEFLNKNKNKESNLFLDEDNIPLKNIIVSSFPTITKYKDKSSAMINKKFIQDEFESLYNDKNYNNKNNPNNKVLLKGIFRDIFSKDVSKA